MKMQRRIILITRVFGGMFICFLCGIALNHYGLVMENICLDIVIQVEETSNTSIVAERLLKNLPKGFILTSSTEKQFVVPNIVHFIWFGENKEMTFINYVSILSAYVKQKPDVLMLHCDHLPVGKFWERLWQHVPIQIMHRKPPDTVHGQTLKHLYHKGDVAKLEILLQYGGIYLDYDVIVLRSLDPLRLFDVTLGKEKPPKFIAGVIVAKKNATFLHLWYQSYKNNYRSRDWDYNCARVTYKVYEKRPDLVHVEPYKLTTPDWLERKDLIDGVIEWQRKDLYVIHLMLHNKDIIITQENVKQMNNTIGEVVRYILYGSPDLIKDG